MNKTKTKGGKFDLKGACPEEHIPVYAEAVLEVLLALGYEWDCDESGLPDKHGDVEFKVIGVRKGETSGRGEEEGEAG